MKTAAGVDCDEGAAMDGKIDEPEATTVFVRVDVTSLDSVTVTQVVGDEASVSIVKDGSSVSAASELFPEVFGDASRSSATTTLSFGDGSP